MFSRIFQSKIFLGYEEEVKRLFEFPNRLAKSNE